MQITLTVIAGPHEGRLFTFADHDTFLVGRSKYAHFQLLTKDKFFSRIHFLMELNPPHCRLVDLNSRNGTYVNGQRVTAIDLKEGDQIKAGHTVLRFSVQTTTGSANLPASAVSSQATSGYQILRELGRGALGVLCLARRMTDGDQVALKYIVPAEAASARQLDAFLKEASALAQLRHPGIVPLRTVFTAESKIVVVSDYVQAVDAKQWVAQRGPLPVAEAVAAITQVLEALEYAHGLWQVHFDIKPRNLLMREAEGRRNVLLTDFGLARVYQASQLSGLTVTRPDSDSGEFLPPERIRHYRDVQPTADQYAAGATLYYLLTGQTLYESSGELSKRLTQMLRSDQVPIVKRRADLPPGLVKVIHRALAREPAKRFRNVKDFKKALANAQ